MSSQTISHDTLDNLQAITEWNQKNFNVLVLDDDPSMTKLIDKIIKDYYKDQRKVFTFNDTSDAIQSFHQGHFDLCILDISLNSCNGFALGRFLRTLNYNEFPIIYISKDKNNLVDFYKNDQPNSYFYTKPIIGRDFVKIFDIMSHSSK